MTANKKACELPPVERVREFLESAEEARIETRRIREKLAWLETQAEHVTPRLSRGRSSGSGLEEGWAMLADMKDIYAERLAAAERRQTLVLEFIDKLPNPLYRMILRYRYCDCLKWEAVERRILAERGGPRLRQILQDHKDALEMGRHYWSPDYERPMWPSLRGRPGR